MPQLDSKSVEQIEVALPQWLAKQRWFSKSGEQVRGASFLETDVLIDSWPKLVWTLVESEGGATYQVPLGMRRRNSIGPVLLGHGDAELCDIQLDGEETVVYDALIDGELNKALFELITNGSEAVNTVRPSGAEQSNTSLIYDNRLILKVFRRLYEGANPDLEVTRKLSEAGFPHVAPVVATWQRDNHDLAVCQPYLWDGTDGWKLALASVRDFLNREIAGGSATAGGVQLADSSSVDPAMAGGDFGEEAGRLGEVTGELHVALSKAFPTQDFDPTELVASLEKGATLLPDDQKSRVLGVVDELRNLKRGEAGCSTRVHGDYHLGQTLRTVSGWYIFDFEGEPVRPLAERMLPNSPMKDVAGMVRSFHYAIAAGLAEQVPSERRSFADAASAWEIRNTEKFRSGYFSVEGTGALIPSNPKDADLLYRAFEIEKAIYELEYERAYRPDWVAIPERALRRLLG